LMQQALTMGQTASILALLSTGTQFKSNQLIHLLIVWQMEST